MTGRRLLGVLALLLLLSSEGWAAFRTRILVKDYTRGQPMAFQAPLTFEPLRLHVETTGFDEAARDTDLVYDAEARKVWFIEHAEKSYVEIDERMLSGVADGVGRGVSLLGDMMRKQGWLGPKAPGIEVTAEQDEKPLWGLPCRRHTIHRGGVFVQEVWLASWADVGITAEDFSAVRQLAASSDRLLSLLAASPLGSGLPELPLAAVAGLDGYPMMIRHYADGKKIYEIFLEPPKLVTPPPGLYQKPDSYKRTLM